MRLPRYTALMIRLYIAEPTPPFAEGLALALNPDQGRYLTSVMRQGVGNQVSLFNGRDGEWTARIAEAGKKTVSVELITQTRTQPLGQGPVLVVALVKRSALETIIEKATELGAAAIHLVVSHRSNSSHTNIERLSAIAAEAAEQTERLDVPQVLPPVKLEKWLGDHAGQALIFADEDSTHEGDDRKTQPILQALHGFAGGAPAILIGPEGGFDDDERRALRGLPHVIAVNLGPRILRADTAAISALTLYQAACGDWR